MATQGILSITRSGQVLFKVVAGCNGDAVERLAKILRMFKFPDDLSLQNVKTAARAVGLGCDECLVVMDKTHIIPGGELDCLAHDYRATFSNPNWNPRWSFGTADFVEIVELPISRE